MFEQQPLTDREVFARGFVNGLASVFTGFVLSVGFAFWINFEYGELILGSVRSVLWWLVACTPGCVAFFSPKEMRNGLLFSAED